MANGEENTETNTKCKEQDKSKEKKKSIEQKLSVLESHGYTLGRSVGSGSYATVKLAHSERHNADVAIKIVSKHQDASDYLTKFLPREIEVVKSLKHNNIIRYYHAIETTHKVYIVMEYAVNGSLLDIIQKKNKIDEDIARKWFLELVSAVSYCHENGVVHRDIKCENLLMDTNYNIKLSDFGFARKDMLKKNGQMKTSSTFCGSYAYASPEILKGVPYQPNASDVWSIGIVLFAMIFGTVPFDDQTYHKLLKQVQKPVHFPKDVAISDDCKRLILKLLAPLKVRAKITDISSEPWCQTRAIAAVNNDTGQKTGREKEPREDETINEIQINITILNKSRKFY